MTNKEWINGAFTESETDYKIAGLNILYKNEKEYIKKGVELLCDKRRSILSYKKGYVYI